MADGGSWKTFCTSVLHKVHPPPETLTLEKSTNITWHKLGGSSHLLQLFTSSGGGGGLGLANPNPPKEWGVSSKSCLCLTTVLAFGGMIVRL